MGKIHKEEIAGKVYLFTETQKDPKHLVCDLCPYGVKLCRVLPHPDPKENKVGPGKKYFSDFCMTVGDDTEGLVPLKGTIEENMNPGDEYFQELIKKNRLVPVQDVIRSVCNGICSLYSPDFSGCRSDNDSCIIHDLLKNFSDGPEGE